MTSIQMSVVNYECLLRKVPKGSLAAGILKNSLIVSSSDSAAIRKMFHMLCNVPDLKLLRCVAAGLCPEALLDIDKGVKFRRPPQGHH